MASPFILGPILYSLINKHQSICPYYSLSFLYFGRLSGNSGLSSKSRYHDDVGSTYLFDCEKYKTERDKMERTVKNVLFREGCTDITCIDLRLLEGNDENLSRNAQNDVIAALMEFIRCSNRF